MTISPEDRPIWLRRYLDEYLTLDQVGELEGITREAVRQRLNSMGIKPRTAEETRRLRERREISSRGEDIRKTFLQTRDVSETAGQLELGVALVERALEDLVPDFEVLSRVPRNVSKKYSVVDLVASLRRAADAVPGILTTNTYDTFVEAHPTLADGRPRPGKQAMMLRFGSWRDALIRAGLPANPHGGPQKEFNEADAVATVVECWRQTGGVPTAEGYDVWQRGQVERPSGATVRKLAGAWNPLLIRAWQLVHGVVLDQDDEDASVPEPLLPNDDAQPDATSFVLYHAVNENTEVALLAGGRVREFGEGRTAAASLRDWVLEDLGAEPEWTGGDSTEELVRWTSGPATTFFAVDDGPGDTTDLGVLRVFTPVATVGDRAAARKQAAWLNASAATNRWKVEPGSYDGVDGELLSIACSFVVGPHNWEELGAFVAWCVAEQVATATAKITGYLAARVGGKPCVLSANGTGRNREVGGWSDVTYHYDKVVEPSADVPADALSASLRGAFLGLRDEMLQEGTGAWFSEEPDSDLLSCEMPATWEVSFDKDIHWDASDPDSQPTAEVTASLTTWGNLGNGLLITMRAASYRADSDEVVNQLNCLDEQAGGATHWVGAWTRDQDQPVYRVFLPSALIQENIEWDAVMREILLTFARQAQLARRVVSGELEAVGLEAPLKPHGLARGETGEGRNPARWYLDWVYDTLVGDDVEWAFPEANGFRWWPYRQPQRVSVVNRDARAEAGEDEVVRVRVTTEILAGVRRTDKNLMAIARRNATLPESALVLCDDGTLVLAFQLTLGHSRSAEGREWIADLAIRQFITARSLASDLSDLGTGFRLRPEPDVWFKQYPEQLREAAASRGVQPESRPQVALTAAGSSHALVHSMRKRTGGGDLDFSWRIARVWPQTPADAEVLVTFTPGTEEADPAWVIRSRLPLTATEAEKARWCNDRNAELLLDSESTADVTVTGGWGLDGDGEACLTLGLTRAFVRGDEARAARTLGYMLLRSQKMVVAALKAGGDLQTRPRPHGDGWLAAAALRAALLRSIGAEPRWLIGSDGAQQIIWSSGPATTAFEIAEGAASTPGLGVLRIYTPVAAGRDGDDSDAARGVCAELNARTGTARWSVAREQTPDGGYYDEVQVSCAFVVEAGDAGALESFALWCVREQIATATAHIHAGDVAKAMDGGYSRYIGFPAGDSRGDLHPVSSFVERVVRPSASLSSKGLADEWLAAFMDLRSRMRAERTGAWYPRALNFPLTFKTPFSWDSDPGWDTNRADAFTLETAVVESEFAEHLELGNGLRISIYVPPDSAVDAGRVVNAVNRLDAEVTGASHSFGGWTAPTTGKHAGTLACVIFLPAAFAETVANRPLVLQEIALTLARQALLARRVLVPPSARASEDYDLRVGLAVGTAPSGTPGRSPRGLAWGEPRDGHVKAVG